MRSFEAPMRRLDRMHHLPHPGELLRYTVLRKDGGITITEFAKQLGVSRASLSCVVNAKAATSAELAIRFAGPLRGSAAVARHADRLRLVARKRDVPRKYCNGRGS